MTLEEIEKLAKKKYPADMAGVPKYGQQDLNKDKRKAFINGCTCALHSTEKKFTEEDIITIADFVLEYKWRWYKEGWCPQGGANGWHCTTKELFIHIQSLTPADKGGKYEPETCDECGCTNVHGTFCSKHPQNQ